VDKGLIERCVLDSGLTLDFLEKDAENISGGEKQRVAIARALALSPEVLLLDEPTTGIDPKVLKLVEETIVKLSRERELTVFWVTHDVEQAKRVADRIANMVEGRITQIAAPDEFDWEGAY